MSENEHSEFPEQAPRREWNERRGAQRVRDCRTEWGFQLHAITWNVGAIDEYTT